MPIGRSADRARVSYTNWTREELIRLRGQLEAEAASADELRAVAEELQRREAPPAPQTIPAAPSSGRPHAVTAPPTGLESVQHLSPPGQPAASRGVQGVQLWVLGSAALMVLGAFGPWVKAFGLSAGGTDGSNDGWVVVAAAAFSALLFAVQRMRRAAGVWGLLGGIAGLAVTLYDRARLQNAIDEGGEFTRAVAQVGWGLNLSIAASASLLVASAVHVWRGREHDQERPAEAARPTPPTTSPRPPTSVSYPRSPD
jgi:hypothetical protein